MTCEAITIVTENSGGWVAYLSALLTPTIALLAISIAFFQLRINRNKLKNELFDRRYKQYECIKSFIGAILREGRVTKKMEMEYLIGISGIKFTYDKKISEYANQTLWHIAMELQELDRMLDRLPVGDARNKNANRQAEIKIYFHSELVGLEDKFSKYLQLNH